MRPTSSKELIKKTAEQLNLPEELVRDVVKYYYKDVRNSLSALEHVKIIVIGLGSFVIKHWCIKGRLAKFKGMQKAYANHNSIKSELVKKEIDKKVDQLQYIYEVCEGEKIKKEKIKSIRREQERDYYERLAKQKENLGGNTQYIISESENKECSSSSIENLPK